MSTSDAAPYRLVDRAVNQLFRAGLDLHRARARAQHVPRRRQRIGAAIGRIDETINELRHAIMPRADHG